MNWYALAVLIAPPYALPTQEFEEIAREEMSALPDTERTVIELFCCGKTLREISREIGFSHETARTLLRRGIKQLRPRLSTFVTKSKPPDALYTPEEVHEMIATLEKERALAWQKFYSALPNKNLRDVFATLDDPEIRREWNKYSAIGRRIKRLQKAAEIANREGGVLLPMYGRKHLVPRRVLSLARRWAEYKED